MKKFVAHFILRSIDSIPISLVSARQTGNLAIANRAAKGFGWWKAQRAEGGGSDADPSRPRSVCVEHGMLGWGTVGPCLARLDALFHRVFNA
jgi:hypothetical protein